MSKTTGISAEIANAIVWLERQPGVTSVVQGPRYNRTRHHHKPGWARVRVTNEKMVHVAVYDKKGMKDVFVYAPPSAHRDQWVAALAGGHVIDNNGNSPQPYVAAERRPTVIKSVVGQDARNVPRPAAQLIEEQAAQIYDVTPDLAAQWLEHNTRNRALRNDTVLKYAADMKAGKWMLTGDSIAFDKNGAIVNGQHRLWAVLESGKTVPMQVTFGLEPDVVRVLDDHLRRNLVDVAKIARPGMTIQTKHASIARMMLFTSRKKNIDRSLALTIPRNDQLAFLEQHWEAIIFTTRDVFKNKNIRAIASTGVMTPVARAFYTQDHDRLVAFGKVMLNGMPEGPEDRGAIVLRNWLLRVNSQGARPHPDIVYRKASRALLAFLEREELIKLSEASKELFLLPEEMPQKKTKARA